ncbi:MAG: hypothetical protein UU23_C0003G0050, partial [Candidatus Curtissbacteria bacterium GW2011_GWA1_40_9]
AATAGAAPVQLPVKFISIFPALAHRNFQFYFAGQAISLIGFWLQQVGLGYYVFQLTHSPFWVGITAAMLGVPMFLFSAVAGVFVERANKQKLLVWTQVLDASVAILFGVVIFNNVASLPVILILAFVSGTIGSVDLPARLTFIVEMVGKRDLASAIPINNGIFNGARFIGPAMAGVLITSFGVGWTFILNGFTYLAGIWAIYNIKPVFIHGLEENIHPFDSMKTGLKYSFTHPKIFYFMLLATVTAVFIWPYQTLMPVVAEKIFNSGAAGLGSLLSAAGAGSLLGAIFTSAVASKQKKGLIVAQGMLISTVALILFAFNRNFTIAHILLFIAGFGVLTQVSTINTLVQLASPDNMRSRIMGVYLTMFVGMLPLGSTLAGSLASRTSSLFTIGIGASIVLVVGTYLYLKGVFTNFNDY